METKQNNTNNIEKIRKPIGANKNIKNQQKPLKTHGETIRKPTGTYRKTIETIRKPVKTDENQQINRNP